ncbi:MAG: hypothetical protein M1569_02005 [Candidatus Marsarchaeota archaeon]|nr:hypothetical protein [Candidatus Marsarchaeota archaeon]MCL5413154.1 hypothetical protein [Candidatus Marsarchaeota archaeon]
MLEIVCSSKDTASINSANAIISSKGLRASSPGVYPYGEIELRVIDESLMHSEFLDELGAELVIFLSSHNSASSVPALTVHSLGNWSSAARFGGLPRTLSVAAPAAMLMVLKGLASVDIGLEKTYEATHHGPLLNTPSMFAEFGGNDETIHSKTIARAFADSVCRSAEQIAEAESEPGKVVMGIGCTHYPQKFTRLALDKEYAFSHILPKYSLSDMGSIDVIDQAATKSSDRPESAIIDWKSIGSDLRTRIIKKLDSIGIGYERI